MTTKHFPPSSLPAVLLLAAALTFSGCSWMGNHNGPAHIYQMGSKARVGALTYSVVDTSWKEALETPNGPRLPKRRFLILNISVANGGGAETAVPLLTLIDQNKREYREEEHGDGLTSWLGLLRTIDPGKTDQGQVLFDVPAGSYQLRVTSGGDPETEVAALIDIPLRVDPPQVQGSDVVQPTTH